MQSGGTPPGSGVAGERPPLHLVSWNVAGLITTTATLAKAYKDDCFARFLNRWPLVDVFCLQEAKVGKKRLDSEPVVCGASGKGGDQHGWESFWAHSDPKHRGMNGVVTFARTGLVHSATNAPLTDPELNGEGRCVAVELSCCVVFNVYVPNSRGGMRTEFRTRYVEALRSAMSDFGRRTGKPVILAGDLNMTYRPVDVHWSHRRLDPVRLASASGAEVDQWLDPFSRRSMLNQILTWMKLQQLPDSLTVGSSAAAEFVEEQMAIARAANGGGDVAIPDDHGDALPLANGSAAASTSLTAKSLSSMGPGSAPPTTQPTHPDNVWLDPFLPKASQPSAPQNLPWYRLSCLAGLTSHGTEANRLLGGLLVGEDGFVDTFAECWPDACGRYTCFNQYNNSRYSNSGSRIDYILVPASLRPAIRRGVGTLPFQQAPGDTRRGPPRYGGLRLSLDEWDGLPQAAAMRAVTQNGRFRPVPFTGGGMQELEAADCDLQFVTCPAHTGMVYTAPQLSDHVAISTLLDFSAVGHDVCQRPANVTLSPSTRECMYRTQQRSIASFFQPKGKATLPAEAATDAVAPPPTKANRSQSNTVAAEVVELSD
jgi:exonuclease III